MPRRECWKAEEVHSKKMEIHFGNFKLGMKKTFSAVGCVRCGRSEKVEKKKLNDKAKQGKSKSGKREVEGARRRLEKKNICVEHLPSQSFGEHCSVPEVDSVGFSFGLSVCVCVPGVPLSVPDVTVPFSSVNGACGVLYDADCEVVEPPRKREAFFVDSKNSHEL